MNAFLKRNRKIVITSLMFQLGWFVCIFAPFWIYGPYLFVFFYVFSTFVSKESQYWIFGVKLAVLGCLVDSILIRTGVIKIETNIIPLWLVSLWLMFALSVPFAFGFLRNRYLIASVLGAIGASTSYLAGVRIRDDVEWMMPMWQGVFILALSWAVIMPYAMFQLSRVENNT